MGANPYESLTFGNSLSLRVDGAIGTMSLSPNGRDAVLAGRKGLFIIDLDDPFTTPRWLHHITSWEVADVQWSPHHSTKPSWVISTSNQKALLWDLARPSNDAIANVLHRHTRAITDINFHPLDPEVLATCSIDTAVYSWDMRTPRRPVGKWSEWRAGATQVKWSRTNGHQLVSSHDHSFYLWDSRKGALPVIRIDNAHKGKINGLDFSCVDDKLTTCSNDKTIKVWDLQRLEGGESSPSVTLRADYPIARARSLPFGKDRCCGIMPLRGGENAIHVVNIQAALNEHASTGATVTTDVIPDYSFKGHRGCVKDFLWRTIRSRYTDFESKHNWDNYQLVSWSSQDYDLKLWPHDDRIYEAASYNPSHQKLFNTLLESPDEPGLDLRLSERSSSNSSTTEIQEETVTHEAPVFNYDTYCTEPQIHMNDLSREFNADFMSSIAYYKIMRSQGKLGGTTQLNHLDWISGVRMGSVLPNLQNKHIASPIVGTSGPSNLGEEVSIVGHKFPKLRFEKISVSTGHLVMTLKGPVPKVESAETHVTSTTENDLESGSVIVSEKSLLSSAKPRLNAVDSASPLKFETQALTSTPVGNSSIGQSSPGINNAITLSQTLVSSSNDESSKPDQEQNLAFIRLEVLFPKSYPHVEQASKKLSSKKKSHRTTTSAIVFNIEETHEITPEIRKAMTEGLNEIADFYTRRFSRFCLEPCLRFLLGDKIDLDESLMLDERRELQEESLEHADNVIEVGNEGWVDDLVDEHNEAAMPYQRYGAVDEDEDEEADLIPTAGDHVTSNQDVTVRGEDKGQLLNEDTKERIKHDTTPLPKGCGAVWSNSGRLVCFFIKKDDEKDKDESDVLAGEFREVSNRDEVDYSGSDDGDSQDDDLEISGSDTSSDTSVSSDDSFADDWDELLRHDSSSRSRVRGFLKDSLRVGDNFFSTSEPKSVTGITGSIGGSASYHRSSAHGDHGSKGKKKRKPSKTVNNVVSIHDYSHLVPDKYELAASYKVSGDTAENLARHNSEVAQYYGYSELWEAWKVLEHTFCTSSAKSTRNLRDRASEVGVENSSSFLWGVHPYGSTWLIEELFNYFEKKLNLQMLAMVSCVLHQYLIESEEGLEESRLANKQLPPWSHKMAPPHRESIGTGGNRATLLAPVVTKKPSLINISKERAFGSIPGSVDDLIIRDQASLRSIVPRTSHSSDLTDQLSIRRTQPSEHSQKVMKAPYKINSRVLGAKSTTLPFDGGEKDKLRTPPSVYLSIKRIDPIRHPGTKRAMPFLNETTLAKTKDFRVQYAEMLYRWGLNYERVKLLKFNYSGDFESREDPHEYSESHCQIGVRYRKALSVSSSLLSPLTPIKSARKNAWNSRQRNHLQSCVLCVTLVNKRALVCANCEHILHPQCAYIWWSEQDEIRGCPTGCGCSCLEHGF